MEKYLYYLTHNDVTNPKFKIALKTAYDTTLNEARAYLLERPEHNKTALNRIITELKRRHKREFNTKLKEDYMNKVFLIGNLTRDPELTETANGVKVCRFSIAVNRSYTGADGNRKTDFFNCTAWRGLGELVNKHVKKGNKVAVTGSIEIENYEDSEGNKRTSINIIASDVEFLTVHNTQVDENKSNAMAADKNVGDGDIPF